MKKDDIICWWSGGVTSAVACKLTIDLFGKDRCRIVFIDTFNEDDDTYRFKNDCEKLYDIPIETITRIGGRYKSIQDTWRRWNSLNVASGAICSSELKREVRKKFQKDNKYSHQVFGFDIDEPKRAKALSMNYPESKPLFPLLLYGLSKKDCIKMIEDNEIEVPNMYKLGFVNNNCFKTGCIQGGAGYWMKLKKEHPEKFNTMSDMEHELTNRKGKPVTMLKKTTNKESQLIFLKQHPDYPEIKTIDIIKGRKPEPLLECNGFCGTNDLEDLSKTYSEINSDGQLSFL